MQKPLPGMKEHCKWSQSSRSCKFWPHKYPLGFLLTQPMKKSAQPMMVSCTVLGTSGISSMTWATWWDVLVWEMAVENGPALPIPSSEVLNFMLISPLQLNWEVAEVGILFCHFCLFCQLKNCCLLLRVGRGLEKLWSSCLVYVLDKYIPAFTGSEAQANLGCLDRGIPPSFCLPLEFGSTVTLHGAQYRHLPASRIDKAPD